MATLVLTAVGGAIGGPLGAAIGGLLGNAFDHGVLFKPKGRQGPRINDLHVQTSTYGSQIPQLFGTMRVAGTVIWATDLRETTSRSGGGKGQPSVTSYNYSCSFAVALSARPIRAVRRIWADGNLLRGAAGDFKTEIGAFRLHGGGPDQPVDPLIAADVGIAQASAHRGIAYALFEDLQLADYGNRIPSLTFEVEADEGPVAIEAIAVRLSAGVLGGTGLATVEGYAATGSDVGDAIAPLIDAHGLAVIAGEGGLALSAAAGTPDMSVSAEMLGARVNGRVLPARERADAAVDTVPIIQLLRHYDPARDYQAGVQRAVRPGAGQRESGIELPAVLQAEAASALAAQRLSADWAGRGRLTLHGDWRLLALTPGMVAQVAGEAGLWRVEEREWEAMAVRVALRRVPGGRAVPAGGTPGAIVRETDAPHGPTTLILAELPQMDSGAANRPLIVAAASGGVGWRRAALFRVDEDGTASPLGRTAPRAVMGMLVTPLDIGSIMLMDERHRVDVTLIAQDMELTPATHAMLSQGANMCLIGNELVQFGTAERIDLATYRLGALRRGLRGTEWAMAHEVGAPFLLLERDRLVDVLASDSAAGIGSVVRVSAIGIGDAEPADAALTIRGEAIMPPSPVHLTVKAADGGWRFDWVWRSRSGWQGSSGWEAPNAEDSERYAVELRSGDATVRATEVATPAWTYDAAAIASDATAGTQMTLVVRQIGSLALGRAATISFTA